MPKFSGHPILYGDDIDFATKVNSINLIITLYIIFDCMKNIQNQ